MKKNVLHVFFPHSPGGPTLINFLLRGLFKSSLWPTEENYWKNQKWKSSNAILNILAEFVIFLIFQLEMFLGGFLLLHELFYFIFLKLSINNVIFLQVSRHENKILVIQGGRECQNFPTSAICSGPNYLTDVQNVNVCAYL